MSKRIFDLELLSPCGDFESVKAAVINGADAVYLGQKSFSARMGAKNFLKDELSLAVSYCHGRGVKVYLTLNTLIFDWEIDAAALAIKQAYDCGVDAFIIQDLGILSLVKKVCPDARLHGSTQMTVHTKKGAEFLKSQGFSRVVLARELNLNEISDISKNVDIETEVFVHGALCMSVSGQCYISAMIGTRSGNRGFCAGSCRLPFYVDKKGSYDLSLKDNCLIKYLNQLESAGVTSLKIEGRMKRPEYCAAATKTYSDALNGIDTDTDILQSVFSRSGFTDGYLINDYTDMFGVRQKEDVISATPALLKKLKQSYEKEVPLIKTDVWFLAKADTPISLSVSDGKDSVTVTGNVPPIAQKLALGKESAYESISKLGGTPFYIDKFDAAIDDGLFVPVKELNELRREAFFKLLELREQRGKVTDSAEFDAGVLADDLLNEVFLAKDEPSDGLFLRYEKYSQIDFSLLDKAYGFSLPLYEVYANKDMLAPFKDILYIELPRASFGSEDEEIRMLSSLKESGFKKIVANNIAHLKIAKELSFKIMGGVFLNCTNSLSLSFLKKSGMNEQVLSFELLRKDIAKLKKCVKSGVICYGKLPLMLFRNCPAKRYKKCSACKGKSTLTDRFSNKFPLLCNKRYTELLNCKPLYLADKLTDFDNLFKVLYFTNESKAEIADITDRFINKLPFDKEFTRGLYYRGVLGGKADERA